MLGDEQVSADRPFRVFGIRHLSPAGAYHLLSFLDEAKPTAVLVEGPSDANGLISHLTAKGVVPPVALLAYTDQLPIRTVMYPFADYSPEYQAFVWASQNRVHAEFIDLPTDRSLSLYDRRTVRAEAESDADTGEGGEGTGRRSSDYAADQSSLYLAIAELSGETDYESFWEREFEHNLQPRVYEKAVYRFSELMRSHTEEQEWKLAPAEAAYNEVREAYMRRKIRETIEAGHDPERIVVVTGAHHASALDLRLPAMSDADLLLLPKAPTRLTLMPYSYYKLSSQSGYGAGNQAPAYFELLWRCMRQRDIGKLPALYMSEVVSHLREQGTYRSTASVIECVRLAEALASLREGSLPTWRDLQDAAIVGLGYGELSVVAEALARTNVGTAIGRLPEGVSQTPVQDDLNRELKRLKLEKYKSAVATTLELDLRENRRVSSADAAFLDLNRSVLLHRLELLGIGFARKQGARQQSATWAEMWTLQWTPEAEIQTVESTLKGETIELAAAFELKEKLEACGDIAEASRLIRIACDCALGKLMEQARAALQQLAVDAGNFEQVAAAVYELSVLISYGSVRRIDTEPLVPLLRQLFLRGALLLIDAASCNDEAAVSMASAIQTMHTVAQEHYETVDSGLWLEQLRQLSSRDDRNAKLSGLSFAVLLEKNEVSDEQCSIEVSRRLSPGIPADLGAGWFEGVSMRNRYALLSRMSLWSRLDEYIATLDEEAFHRALVFLRRAFGAFEPREKAAVAEMMGDLWGFQAEQIGSQLQEPLTEEEKEKLNELNDFDFGDL
ncbi:DUF5682 family protein [Paenibacillus ginsengarvi]|uniref:Uncharacterized protein n=1 Tax=Paenibacillus ginsengarvi TaxID=400777 RepID=A0A3B0BSX9_9BACL|nr:DUF5682 family protein [Paenibacillus ginsengarvi]RKN75960.1 hypothetical protein D7M11_24470 [Paenibacillus ginsengarvi]